MEIRIEAKLPELTDDAIKKTLEAGTAILNPEIKRSLEEAIARTPKHYSKQGKLLKRSQRTGGLVKSQRVSPISKTKRDENFIKKVYFTGKNAKGIRYGAIAGIKEYGVKKGRTQAPSDFMKNAVNAKRTRVEEVMKQTLEQELHKQ
jgi:histidinol dehydrogenase